MGIKDAIAISGLVAAQMVSNLGHAELLNEGEVKKMKELRLNEVEMQFFKAYINLVNKYPHLKGQFGLARLYDHFDMQDGEALHETTDYSQGTSTVKKTSLDSLPIDALPAVIDDGYGDLMNSEVRTWCCD